MSGILNAISSLGASVINGITTLKATKASAQAQKDVAQINIDAQNAALEKQRAQQLEDRAHEESYNSPLMERLRLEAAGLAPAEYAGQTVPTSSPEVPDYTSPYRDNGQALVSAAGLGATAPMALMSSAMSAAKTISEIHKDNSYAADASQSAEVKKLNADLLKETFQDQVLKAKLENGYLFQQTNKAIEEAASLVVSRKLSQAERKAVLQNMRFAQELQEFRVRQAKAESEIKETDVKISQYQLDELLPAQVSELKARAAELDARASLDRSEKRRIDTLLPLEAGQLQELVQAISLANSDAGLAHDENIVKHNKWMSHIQEYEDALVANYSLSKKEANWYAVEQFTNVASEVVNSAIRVYGLGVLGSSASTLSKGLSGSLLNPGNTSFERLSRDFRSTVPGAF